CRLAVCVNSTTPSNASTRGTSKLTVIATMRIAPKRLYLLLWLQPDMNVASTGMDERARKYSREFGMSAMIMRGPNGITANNITAGMTNTTGAIHMTAL